MKRSSVALALCVGAFAAVAPAAAVPAIAPEGPPIEVVVLGTFHFANPGQDIANIQVDDVLAPKRQAEIARIRDGLARFKPTKIAVEAQRRQPGTNFSERYPLFRAGKMEPSANEVVQLGSAPPTDWAIQTSTLSTSTATSPSTPSWRSLRKRGAKQS